MKIFIRKTRDVKQLLRFPYIQWETEQETRSVSHCIQGKRKSCLTSLRKTILYVLLCVNRLGTDSNVLPNNGVDDHTAMKHVILTEKESSKFYEL
jgi:hypothetical protein